MEARGRMSLPHWGKYWDAFNFTSDCDVHNRRRAPTAGEAEDAGGTAAAGDRPRPGNSSSPPS